MHEDAIHIVCPSCESLNRVPSGRLSHGPICGKCKRALFNGHPINLGEGVFKRHIERNDIPVLVDFWAGWCGPCKMMAPQFQQAARHMEPRVRLAKVNTEESPGLSARYSVSSIPLLILFHKGREIARHAGAMGASDIATWASQFSLPKFA